MAYTALSIFDLDYTLVSMNTSFRFGLHLPRQKSRYVPPSVICIWYYLLYQAHSLSLTDLHEKAFQTIFKGRSLVDIQETVSHFLMNEFESHLYLPALERLRQAQNNNHYTVIVSSSPAMLVEPIAKKLEVNSWAATQYSVDDKGIINGIEQIVEGNYKARMAQSLMADMAIDSSCLTAYSDSLVDLPLLKVAGHPVGVNPDKHLKRICEKNGWEII